MLITTIESWIIGINHMLKEYDLNQETLFSLIKLRKEMYILLRQLKYEQIRKDF